MFHWLKKRLAAWAEEHQRREIARLRQESKRLTREIEQTIDKTFLIAKPMGKVSWTKCFAAGGGSVGGGLEWWMGLGWLTGVMGRREEAVLFDARSVLEAASSFV